MTFKKFVGVYVLIPLGVSAVSTVGVLLGSTVAVEVLDWIDKKKKSRV